MKTSIKKIALALFAVILCLSFASCGNKDDYVPVGYKRVSNGNADHVLYVPESWIVDMSTGVTTARVSKTDSSNISFMSFDLADFEAPTETEAATGETENQPETDAIDDFWAYYSEEFKKTFPDITYDEDGYGVNMLVSKLAAKKYVYTATVTGASYKFMQIVVIKNDTVYLFTYTAKAEVYDTHEAEALKIAGYIEIK